MRREAAGLTLTELLCTLAVAAILCAMSLPRMGSLVQRKTGEALIMDLAGLMNFARARAVTTGRMTTLCRSADGEDCRGSWNEGILVFSDANGDRELNGNDEVLRYRRMPGGGELRLRAFPNRQYVQFTPLGFTNRQNGNFTWCPPDRDPALARQLIFSQSGRSRFARDSDGDGIREAADGDPLNCG